MLDVAWAMLLCILRSMGAAQQGWDCWLAGAPEVPPEGSYASHHGPVALLPHCHIGDRCTPACGWCPCTPVSWAALAVRNRALLRAGAPACLGCIGHDAGGAACCGHLDACLLPMPSHAEGLRVRSWAAESGKPCGSGGLHGMLAAGPAELPPAEGCGRLHLQGGHDSCTPAATATGQEHEGPPLQRRPCAGCGCFVGQATGGQQQLRGPRAWPLVPVERWLSQGDGTACIAAANEWPLASCETAGGGLLMLRGRQWWGAAEEAACPGFQPAQVSARSPSQAIQL
jgi:hypothetical protein